MKIAKEYERIATMVRIKFSKELYRRDPVVVEVLVMLVLSLLLGRDTIHEVAERLGIPRNQLYGALKKLSPQDWHKLFAAAFDGCAMRALLEAQSKSDATWSRLEIVLALDDSVIRRWGRVLSYLGKWWSGQFHRVVPGHDVVMAVLKVGDLVIPVGFWLMSLKGRLNNRHERARCLLEQLGERWKRAGIQIRRIPVSMDAGYADSALIEAIRKAGFGKVITGAKGDYRLYPGRSKKHSYLLRELLKKSDIEQDPGWGCCEPVGFLKGTSPTFGKVRVCARFILGKVRRVFAFGVYRACEIVHIWKSHHSIEECFKRLKHLLSWGSYCLRGKSGAHAAIVIPFLVYFILLELQQSFRKTFYRLLKAIEQWAYLDIDGILECWNIEGFELKLVTPDDMLIRC
jgi:hypothetical protein